jgi:hypothetical protein
MSRSRLELPGLRDVEVNPGQHDDCQRTDGVVRAVFKKHVIVERTCPHQMHSYRRLHRASCRAIVPVADFVSVQPCYLWRTTYCTSGTYSKVMI